MARAMEAGIHARRAENGALKAEVAALEAQAEVVIPGLPFEVVVTHVLGSENLSDVADLARLRAVSPAMKVAVAATRRKVEMLDE